LLPSDAFAARPARSIFFPGIVPEDALLADARLSDDVERSPRPLDL
jgi:hypothetical protein